MHLENDTLLLADVFGNFREMCLNIYHIDSANFFSAFWLLWQAALKKSKVKLESLTDIGMLLMVEKVIIGGICHAIHRYTKVW